MLGASQYASTPDMGKVILDPRSRFGADQQYNLQLWRPWDVIYHPNLAADVDTRGRGYTVPYNKQSEEYVGNLPVSIQVAQLGHQTFNRQSSRILSLTIPPQG